MKQLIANDIVSLNDIIDLIHDCWFDVTNIENNASAKIVSIKFAYEDRKKSITQKRFFLFKKLQIPYYESYLKFYNVEKFHLDDEEKVGSYDFNTLVFYPEQKKIVVKTGIPLVLEVQISELRLSLEITEKIIRWKTVTTIFW